MPISQVAYLTLSRKLQSDGAALFSMSRNVFGAIGISAATALVTERTQAAQAHLSEWATPLWDGYNTYVQQSEAALRAMGRAPETLNEQAVLHAFKTYLQQAQVLGYSNAFLYTSVLAFVLVPFCFLITAKKA